MHASLCAWARRERQTETNPLVQSHIPIADRALSPGLPCHVSGRDQGLAQSPLLPRVHTSMRLESGAELDLRSSTPRRDRSTPRDS